MKQTIMAAFVDRGVVIVSATASDVLAAIDRAYTKLMRLGNPGGPDTHLVWTRIR